MRRLKQWNGHVNAWASRYPWGYGIIHSTVLVGMFALILGGSFSEMWLLWAGMWVVGVLIGGLIGKLLPPERATPVASSLPPGTGAMDEDGRCHRQGLP